MAHAAQLKFFELVFSFVFPKQESKVQVIDFGSLDINGGPHQLLGSSTCNYVGVDIDKGDNVSIVMPGELVDFPSSTFKIAMSSELFEHTPAWREILYNMCRLTQPGGIVVFTCAGRFRREHGTSRSDNGYSAPFVVAQGVEYYGNVSASSISRAFSLDYWFDRYRLFEAQNFKDTYFVGIRKNGTESELREFESLCCALDNRYSLKSFFGQYVFFKSFLSSKTSFLRPILHRVKNQLVKPFSLFCKLFRV
jgi:SAM-dependent methyltransferase